jgi:hypothetical protein
MPMFKPSPVCLVPAFNGSMPAIALSVVLLPVVIVVSVVLTKNTISHQH